MTMRELAANLLLKLEHSNANLVQLRTELALAVITVMQLCFLKDFTNAVW